MGTVENRHRKRFLWIKAQGTGADVRVNKEDTRLEVS